MPLWAFSWLGSTCPKSVRKKEKKIIPQTRIWCSITIKMWFQMIWLAHDCRSSKIEYAESGDFAHFRLGNPPQHLPYEHLSTSTFLMTLSFVVDGEWMGLRDPKSINGEKVDLQENHVCWITWFGNRRTKWLHLTIESWNWAAPWIYPLPCRMPATTTIFVHVSAQVISINLYLPLASWGEG